MSIKAANNVFPHDPDDNWKQKLDRGGYEGTAKDLDDKINGFKNPDGILISGSISKIGNVVSIGEMTFKCRIDNNVLTNLQDFSTTIVNATENYKRIDILVFTKFSTIVKIQGDEELESAKEPDVPPGTIKLSFISVFGSEIIDPSQPILIPDISEKLDKGGYQGTASDLVLGAQIVSSSEKPEIDDGDNIGFSDSEDFDKNKKVSFAKLFNYIKSKNQTEISYACSDETSDLSVGTLITFRMPFGLTVSRVKLSLNTGPTLSKLIVDVKKNGVSIFSTLVSVDTSQTTSNGASVPAVISQPTLNDDAVITIHTTQIGSGTAGKGLKVTLIGIKI